MAEAETKVCQNCKGGFRIEPEDLNFYTKMGVPPPTFCPACRLQRRLAWRNERSFHKGKDARTGKEFLTMFPAEAGMTVYDRDHWWGDDWDQFATGRDYDFNKPFFVQFVELMRRAPLPNLAISNSPGVVYGNHNTNCKNCYLAHASYGAEDCAYVNGAVDMKDSFDLYKAMKGNQCYEDILCGGINQVFFSYDSDESIQSAFLSSCKNVQESLACVNVHNRSHCIWNTQYSKEEYEKERAKYDLGSYAGVQDLRARFKDFELTFPQRYASLLKCLNCTGDMMMAAKNCKSCFDVYGGDMQDCKYCCHAFQMQDCYDTYGAGDASELLYEAVDVGVKARKCAFSIFTHGSQNVNYTYGCFGSADLFGCIGLRSARYCILNKQYSKEEYDALLPKVIAHMNEVPYVDAMGRRYGYGEFFPAELSPFAYNETLAHEYMPLTAPEARAGGYRWREASARHYEGIVPATALPDHIKDASDSLLQSVIECAHKGECNQQCTGAFKIIPSELQFHRHFNLALPRLCPNCRHYERLARRNPFKLWKGVCQCAGSTSLNGIYQNSAAHFHGAGACPNQFETSYAPGRPEIVYCEQCYQSEIV